MDTPKRFSLLPARLLLLLPLVAAGCTDGTTGPGSDGPDLAATAAAVEDASSRFFTNNQGVQAVNRMSPHMTDAGVALPPGAVLRSLDPARFRGSAHKALARLESSVTASSSTPATAAIASELLGKTLVFDPELGRYVPDESRTDAPENGVRFILYELDPETHELVLPLVEVGHLDIVDTSTSSALNVGLITVVEGVTLIDLATSLTATETSADVTLTGFISDGEETFDVDLSVTATGTEQEGSVSGDVTMTTTTGITLELSLEATGSLESETGTATAGLVVRHQGHVITYSVDVDQAGTITGEVEIDGAPFAVIEIDLEAEEVTLTNGEGGELSQEELEALERILDAGGTAAGAGVGLFLLTLVLLGFGAA